ncbi:MAG: hypothetical protein NPIRA02_40140 [Nitrospirales bacterium]|nr:MAG: hypothetical protein NPIRA02_40140 [Nitrospirales bacterium]
MRYRPHATYSILRTIMALFIACGIVAFGITAILAQSAISDYNRDVIEALIFGSGPLGAEACPAHERWAGFPRGSTINVIVSTTVSNDKRHQIRSTLRQISHATHGAITVSLHITQEPEPPTGDFRVISMTHPIPTRFGCTSNVGCTHHEWQTPGVLKSSRAVQPEGQTRQAYAHDVIGHGILGMCHIQAKGIGGPHNSLMSGGLGVYSGQNSGRLTALDIAALQAVYASSLSPGATLNDFIEAGLISNP